jgi:hypothetical protein
VAIIDMDNATRLGIADAFTDQRAERPDTRIGKWHLGRALRRRLPDPIQADPGSPVMQRLAPRLLHARPVAGFRRRGRARDEARTHGPLAVLLRRIDDHDALMEHQAATPDARSPNSTSPI